MTDIELNTPAPAASTVKHDARYNRRGRARCPHCEAPAKVRTSRTLAPTYTELTYQCTNVLCGHTYVVGAEVLRTLSPSAIPNPDVHIPLSTHSRAGAGSAKP